MKVEASAPSNIALIKYMGKTAATGNLPANPSLSYALDHLRSFVTIEQNQMGHDQWQLLAGLEPLSLSESGQQRFLAHFKFLKQRWNIGGDFTVASANNFSADCGLASSASSFAALTLATARLARRQNSPLELSQLSRQGSGSSCRSFFSPWALWQGAGAVPVEELECTLEHAVVMVAGAKKEVSSSNAHQRVTTSLLFHGRVERAQTRLQELLASLRSGDWQRSYQLCWSEFQDMHALFATSQPHFSYMTSETLRVLTHLQNLWRTEGDGPLVTMDAGANVHVFVRPEQTAVADRWLTEFSVVKSWAARG